MKILILDSGGTISQKPDAQGIYRPSSEDFLGPNSALRKKLESQPELEAIELIRLKRIDSSVMDLEYRKNMGRIIAENISAYDGFVIIHGTDTMAESAACLSYMLRDLGKPVVLTGAQLSYFERQRASDAERNIFYAVQCAREDFGEVLIFFGHIAIRGTRAYKENSFHFDAFASSSLPPLAEAGTMLYLYEHRVRRRSKEKPSEPKTLQLFSQFNPNIAFFTPISGAHNDKLLYKLAAEPEVEAILLTGFGSGNLGPQYLAGIEAAVNQGKPVCIVSSCIAGVGGYAATSKHIHSMPDPNIGLPSSPYLSGAMLSQAGACHVQGITSIAAGQKMMYALGRAQSEGHRGETLRQRVYQIMRTPLCGDIL